MEAVANPICFPKHSHYARLERGRSVQVAHRQSILAVSALSRTAGVALRPWQSLLALGETSEEHPHQFLSGSAYGPAQENGRHPDQKPQLLE
eukprot:CAMPEP_0181219950 /NCGR_PEP_ID=MMETSP1096-20121128/28570_1 /TAXON_ID=156174 ORGANISM="Chrysochromulina ericina, Strain CCMP281" /NCGR_SAMPLE_ID=MMETSP1096 /ASSEMBLY_ACC=CAM_ASM_000453 /LENGTH=91 /DNA_ID=CAMNT_0023312407 /DNA_START=420 /DNA_END=695 /DNA_ORIENTATION=+